MVALVLNGKDHTIRIDRDVKVLQRRLGWPNITEDRLDPIDHLVTAGLFSTRPRAAMPAEKIISNQ